MDEPLATAPDFRHHRRMTDRPRALSHVLEDGEELNRQNPRTFFIPPRSVRAGLQPGDVVKLVFVDAAGADDEAFRERMWVEVTARVDGGYLGRLDNEPRHIVGLEVGDEVAFAPEHVVAVWDADAAPSLKVIMSRRSHVDDVRPGFVDREPPRHPTDSGWACMVGDETEEELDDSGAFLLQELDFVLARWPELEPVFAVDEERSSWEWDESSGSYLPAQS